MFKCREFSGIKFRFLLGAQKYREIVTFQMAVTQTQQHQTTDNVDSLNTKNGTLIKTLVRICAYLYYKQLINVETKLNDMLMP